jgi:hypothetical protein
MNTLRGVALAVWMAASTAVLSGQQLGVDFDSYTGGFWDSGNRVIGWEFTVGSGGFTVQKVGVYDHNGDGLLHPHDVGIYRVSDQSLVYSTTILANALPPLYDGRWRMVDVVPLVELLPGEAYVIVAVWFRYGDEWLWDRETVGTSMAGVTAHPGIRISSAARYSYNTMVLAFPNSIDPPDENGVARSVFIGPNFMGIPEPPAAGLLGGLAILGAVLRRRRR